MATQGPLLLTGAAGALGQSLRPHLAKRPGGLRSSDIRDPGKPFSSEEIMVGDLGDARFVDRIVAGTSAVVHLGAVSTEDAVDKIFHANIHGTYHVFESMMRHGVKRMVFASSNHAIGYHRVTDRLDATAVQKPDTMYGVSKAFGENLGSFFSDKFGLEVACLRIGSAFPEPTNVRQLATWLSYADLLRLVIACLDAPKLKFAIVYGASKNSRTYWDNSRSGIDFRPQDSADGYAAKLMPGGVDPRDPKDPATHFQGGFYVNLKLGEKPKL